MSKYVDYKARLTVDLAEERDSILKLSEMVINNMIKNGYHVELVNQLCKYSSDGQSWEYYCESHNVSSIWSAECMWKDAVQNKETDILYIYQPLWPAGINCRSDSSYTTAFDVVHKEEQEVN